MMKKYDNNLTGFLSSAITVAGLFMAQQAAASEEPPRGPDVESLAGNCGIGPFAQTSKAGVYNSLCKEMGDAEKCLGFIKGQFLGTGEVSPVYEHEIEKARYCLETLKAELGVGED